MKCRRIEKKLAAQESLDSSETAHLNSCESCRQFAASIQQFDFVDFSTPTWTRMRTHHAFLQALEENHKSLSLLQKLEHLVRLPRYIIGLTVLFVALFTLLLIVQPICDDASVMCKTMSIIIIIVIMQNIITALFFPILFQGKLNNLK